jgi:hypothetical protein
MIIKLAANNLPSYVEQVEASPGVTGYVIYFPSGSSDTMSIGDFIIENSPTDIRLIRRTEYDSNSAIKAEIAEQVGRATNRNIIALIRALLTSGSPISNADKLIIAEYLCTVFVFLGDGFIQDARDIASKGTTTVYTASRRTAVLAEIDKALLFIA